MYWQEDSNSEQFQVPDDVVDVLFSIDCPCLPVDHAQELSEQLQQKLPWFADEGGLHLIHGAESGNGWERPQGADDLLYLPRRTKLMLRLPRERLQDASVLSGLSLQVNGHSIKIGGYKQRLLGLTTVLYSRYVVDTTGDDEDAFLAWAVSELKALRLRFKKVLAGKRCEFAGTDAPIATRSLLVADMPHEDAVLLQQQGLGPKRAMGCGLFVPHKTF